MLENKLTIEKKYEILRNVLVFVILISYAFFINRKIRISGLYMDDLYMWSFYGEQSFREFVFPIGSIRFRPLFWFVSWIELGFIGSNIGLIVPINIIIAAINAFLIYLFAKKISKSAYISFIFAIIFLSSRFAYYNISQLLGIMEALALILVLGMFYFLYKFINEGRKSKDFYTAILLYLAVCFTHERYMVLFPMLLYVLIVSGNKNILKYFASIFSFVILQLIRRLTIGSVLPAGTGGTEVAETFTVNSFIKSIISEVLYVFGVNAGPDYLNGIPWDKASFHIKVIVYIAISLIFILLIYFITALAKKSMSGIKISEYIINSILFLGFIAGSIISSAVTIRVEMRWVYAPYMFALLFMAYIYGIISDKSADKEKGKEYFATSSCFSRHKHTGELIYAVLGSMPVILISIWFALMLYAETYFRSYYPYIYLFPNQKRYNSLADETVGKYGTEVLNKDIYIIGNEFEMSKFTADTFFKVYAKDKKTDTKVMHVDSVKDLPIISDSILVLKEDVKHDTFIDITAVARDIKLDIRDGYYHDGFLENEAGFGILSTKSGRVKLEFLYDGIITGNEITKIKYGDKEVEYIFREGENSIDLEVEPEKLVYFELSTNFTNENLGNPRSDKPLSLIMYIELE